MTAPTNLSFETGTGGAATAWVLTVVSTYEAMADYGTPAEPWERFEAGWSSNEAFLFAFAPENLGAAVYGTVHVGTVKTAEDFEELWLSNESYLRSLDSPEPSAALYGGALTAERFESGWSSNESNISAFVGPGTDLDPGDFEGTDTPENFEAAGWSAGYATAFVGVGTDLVAATYVNGTLTHDNFEAFIRHVPVALDLTTNHVLATAHPFVGSQRLTFEADIYPAPLQANQAYYVHSTGADWFKIGLDPAAPGDIVFTQTPVGTLNAVADPVFYWVDGMVTTAF